MSTERLGPDELLRAAELIKEGKLVAFPTETVYGLGASIFNPAAIQSIFQVKGRPADNPLIAHISSLVGIEQIAVEIPAAFELLAKAFFPGPLTVVLKRHPRVPSIVSAGLDSIALRMPSHPIASKLISLVGHPIVAPSANLSGKPSSTCHNHVLEDFDGHIAAVIEGGNTDFGIESTVVSLLGEIPAILRPGSISKEEIEQVLGNKLVSHNYGPIVSPGMKYRHYSPKTPIQLLSSFETLKQYHLGHPSLRMVLALRPLPEPLKGADCYSLSAREFYSLLRLADQKKYAEILVLCDEELKTQLALMNRLLHAAGKHH